MPQKPGNILIIDDDEAILLTLRILLRKHFGEIVTANTPQKITHLLNQQHFHVVMLDMNFTLGVTSGKEGFRWLAEILTLSPHTKVVMMTAYGDIGLAIRALKEGASDFVIKPWDNEKLLETIDAAFRQSQMFAEEAEKIKAKTYGQQIEEVERIFMFLDIRDSTRIAEELGHIRYFALLNRFFSDISGPIDAHKGEIYQYVGDEIVVSWEKSQGLEDGNCLKAFFAIQERIRRLAPDYEKEFGLIPAFKAGFHMGNVTTGAIGTIKKEVVFSGDVLNTTARIEALCNRYGVDMLMSEELWEALPRIEGWEASAIGDIMLRGKQRTIRLLTLRSPVNA